jgi:lactate racemase
MTIPLLYGKGTLDIAPPAGCVPTIIRKEALPILSDPTGSVGDAFDRPISMPPLGDIARGARTACILICDITRPVPNGLFLGPLIRRLFDAGIPASGVTVLVATGLHRPNEGEELSELVGDPWVLETVKVINHDARDDDAHAMLGKTSKGTIVRLDKRLMDADLKIATGLVEPHFMAGWSGGRKVIAPGIAHAETITTFHNAEFMSHPKAANCVLDGNPLHEEQLEIVGMLGGAYALNTVIDEERRLAFVNFGEIVSSHLQAVDFVRQYARVPVKRRFKTVVTSAAGYPLDKTYYQTVKGMVGPLDILEPGGDLIIASACSEGMGSPHYVEAQRRLVALGNDGFLADISRKSHADIDEWQTQMQLRTTKVSDVHLFTNGLSNDDGSITGVHRISSVELALAESIARHGESNVAIVPEGPYVVPFYSPT